MIWVKNEAGSEGRVYTEGSLKRSYNTANWIIERMLITEGFGRIFDAYGIRNYLPHLLEIKGGIVPSSYISLWDICVEPSFV